MKRDEHDEIMIRLLRKDRSFAIAYLNEHFSDSSPELISHAIQNVAIALNLALSRPEAPTTEDLYLIVDALEVKIKATWRLYEC